MNTDSMYKNNQISNTVADFIKIIIKHYWDNKRVW